MPRVLHYSTISWHAVELPWHHPWHTIRHLHGIPWRGLGSHGTPWGATPAGTATVSPTSLYGNLTACHGNDHGTAMSSALRVGLGSGLGLGLGFHGMPWRSMEGSMVCRGGPWKVPWYAVEDFAAGGATAMPRHVAKKVTKMYIRWHHTIILFRGSSTLFYYAGTAGAPRSCHGSAIEAQRKHHETTVQALRKHHGRTTEGCGVRRKNRGSTIAPWTHDGGHRGPTTEGTMDPPRRGNRPSAESPPRHHGNTTVSPRRRHGGTEQAP